MRSHSVFFSTDTFIEHGYVNSVFEKFVPIPSNLPRLTSYECRLSSWIAMKMVAMKNHNWVCRNKCQRNCRPLVAAL